MPADRDFLRSLGFLRDQDERVVVAVAEVAASLRRPAGVVLFLADDGP